MATRNRFGFDIAGRARAARQAFAFLTLLVSVTSAHGATAAVPADVEKATLAPEQESAAALSRRILDVRSPSRPGEIGVIIYGEGSGLMPSPFLRGPR